MRLAAKSKSSAQMNKSSDHRRRYSLGSALRGQSGEGRNLASSLSANLPRPSMAEAFSAVASRYRGFIVAEKGGNRDGQVGALLDKRVWGAVTGAVRSA